VARKAGRPVDGVERDRMVDRAWRRFINDTFWLNPLAKLFDGGVVRTRIDGEHGPELLLRYTTGGVTPGDAYLWILDAADRPRAWRVWVKILPIPGLEFSWEGWTRLPTGAWISTVHRALRLRAVSIEELAGAASLPELEPGPDPFAELAR
jgi:hypothetical protein